MTTNLSRRRCVKCLSLVENEHLSFHAVTVHYVCPEVLWYAVGDKFCLYSVFKSYVNYRKIYNIKRTKFQNLNVYRVAVAFAQYIEAEC